MKSYQEARRFIETMHFLQKSGMSEEQALLHYKKLRAEEEAETHEPSIKSPQGQTKSNTNPKNKQDGNTTE